MRRVSAILIGLLVLAHMLVPALPTYICQGMGGIHVNKPCCAADAPRNPAAPPLLRRARCCDSAPPLAIDASWTPKTKARALCPAPVATAIAMAITPASHLTLSRGARRLSRGDPTGLGPPAALYRILRI